jgi:Calpain family cysteine protease
MRFQSTKVAPLSAATNLLSELQGNRFAQPENSPLTTTPVSAVSYSSSPEVAVTPAAQLTGPRDAELSALSQQLGADGSFARYDMVLLLRNAGDNGSVDATELADLQAIVSPSAPVVVPEYVRVLANKIVNGDLANLNYQGSALGNLAAGSSTAHINNLVDQWFYGTDRPKTSYAYGLAEGVLFKDGVKETDIKQGIAIDCYLLAAVGAVAQRSPQNIQQMFIDNGDNTYTVRFINNGVADYVTVDRYMPSTAGGNFVYCNMGTKLANPENELWVALLEKAYAQINESGWIGQDGTNSYDGIASGYVEVSMTQITGRAAGQQRLNQSTFIGAVQAGEMVTINTPQVVQSVDIVKDHAYVITSYNADTQQFTLFSTWGAAGNKDAQGVFKPGILELSWGEISANFSYGSRSAAA